MSFIFYDIETTGIHRHFDQILQFAAIKTNENFEEVERFEISCRLQPHIIPAPRALITNGLSIGAITQSSLASYFEMVCRIHARLSAWSPAMFLGYNSIKFDEEFLRNAFYQCMLPPYLTNTRPNIRGDVLRLVRALSLSRPDAINVPIEEGRPSFKLANLAMANGFPEFKAHEAIGDVRATAFLCEMVAKKDETLWSQFQRCAQRASAVSFLEDGEAFLFFDASPQRSACVATLVGRNRDGKSSHIYYCINLNADLSALRGLSKTELDSYVGLGGDIVHRVKVNACPIVLELSDAPQHLRGAISEYDWYARGRAVREDSAFVERLVSACEKTEKTYPPGTYVEELLYEGGFYPDPDKIVLNQFHSAAWPDRAALAYQLSDKRLQQLSRRLIYLERADLVSGNERSVMTAKMRDRIFGTGVVVPPWTTVSQALESIDLELPGASTAAATLLQEYRSFLVGLGDP